MAYFTFTDASRETFVIRLDDPQQIAHARALLAGTATGEARIGGTIVKAPASYNIGWSYRLDPDDTFFFDMSTEVGDSTMRYIESHLGEIGGHLLPGNVWTGWSSTLTGELNVRAGGSKSDVLTGKRGADLLLGEGGSDILFGRDGNDHLSGGSGRDVLFGGDGADKLGGDSGNDVLHGGKGADLLVGGRGNDIMAGGSGRDIFQFDAPASAGRDTILDFDGGADRLRLSSAWLSAVGDVTGDGKLNRADLAAAFVERGDDLVLKLGGHTRIVLVGGADDPLAAGDFLIG